MLEWIITIICEIWETKEEENDGGDGGMESIWMGPVAPTLANLPICDTRQFLKTFPSLKKYMTSSKTSTLVGKIHFVDNSNHFNTFTLSHVHHHTNYPRRAL